jgi:hypothetical protein
MVKRKNKLTLLRRQGYVINISQNINPLKYTGYGAQKDKEFIFYLTYSKRGSRMQWYHVYYGDSMKDAKRYYADALWTMEMEDVSWAAARAK